MSGGDYDYDLNRVMRFDMATQIDFALERLRTTVTCEWLVTGVFSGVGDQVRALTECLAAHGALCGATVKIKMSFDL